MKNFIFKLKGVFSFFRIDYSFFVMLILFFFLDELRLYLIYLLFIFLHEMSHLIVAKRLGYLPKKLKLTAFGASLEGFDDFLTSDEIKIAIAGPFFNFLVVIACYLSFWFYPESYSLLSEVLTANLSILIFNLLPIFPLDAGRLVLCFLSKKHTRFDAVKKAKNISLVFIAILFLISIFTFFLSFSFTLGFVSLNLCLLLFSSSSDTSYKREILLRKKIARLNKGIPKKVLYVDYRYSENMLLKFLDGEHYFVFIFVDDSFKIIREIDEFNLLLNLGFI